MDYLLNIGVRNMTASYKPKYEPSWIDVGTHPEILIICGWKPRFSVKKKFKLFQYAGIGQLYCSKNGLSVLIRNLLLNPTYRKLLILNTTEEDRIAGSTKCLIDWINNGLLERDESKAKHKINSEVEGYIDKEIPLDVLETLRGQLNYVEVTDIANLITCYDKLNDMTIYYSTLKSLEFPMPEINSSILPASIYGQRVEAQTVAEAWVKAVHAIRSNGHLVPTTYGTQRQEVINLISVIHEDLNQLYLPNYMGVTKEFLEKYAPTILSNAKQVNDGEDHYTYGQRLRSYFSGVDQVQECINKLSRDLTSTSVVMNLWDSSTDLTTKNAPCLNHIWLRVKQGHLTLVATLRSNDIYRAYPSNALGLRMLQKHILDVLNKLLPEKVSIGPLVINSQSAHIYENSLNLADELIREQYPSIARIESTNYSDPCGNFVVSKSGKKVKVTQLHPVEGTPIREYESLIADNLCQQVVAANPTIQATNLAYIAIEAQKFLNKNN